MIENKAWAAELGGLQPDYFSKHLDGQSPEFLWIGSADSRVAVNQMTNSDIGEIFVHYNIANVIDSNDMNLMSVLQYAVEYLKVKHIIVCGHYGCLGVQASLENQDFGLLNNWLRHIKDVYQKHQEELEAIKDKKQRFDRMVELNVITQVNNLAHTNIVQKAWKDSPLPIL
ncbi:MAG: carbonic anhydrase, partial [Bacteroidota bacterium]